MLVAEIGGFLGRSYRVELSETGDLIYLFNPRTFTTAPGTIRKEIRVTDQQWQRFRSHLDAAKVWRWKAEYVDQTVRDGTFWKLEVDFGDRRIKTVGRNAFPEPRQFEAFTQAVEELLGGADFK